MNGSAGKSRCGTTHSQPQVLWEKGAASGGESWVTGGTALPRAGGGQCRAGEWIWHQPGSYSGCSSPTAASPPPAPHLKETVKCSNYNAVNSERHRTIVSKPLSLHSCLWSSGDDSQEPFPSCSSHIPGVWRANPPSRTGLTAPSPSYTGAALPDQPSKKSKQTHSLPGFRRFEIQSHIIQLRKTTQGTRVSNQFVLFSEDRFDFWSSISPPPRRGTGRVRGRCSEHPPGTGVPSPHRRPLLRGSFTGPLGLEGAKLLLGWLQAGAGSLLARGANALGRKPPCSPGERVWGGSSTGSRSPMCQLWPLLGHPSPAFYTLSKHCSALNNIQDQPKVRPRAAVALGSSRQQIHLHTFSGRSKPCGESPGETSQFPAQFKLGDVEGERSFSGSNSPLTICFLTRVEIIFGTKSGF